MKKIGLYFCCLLVILLASCKSGGGIDKSKTVAEKVSDHNLLNSVVSNNVLLPAITAKMKFEVEYDKQKFGVGGNLKMKRDDVIQLSLVGFGIIEGGRVEFTRDRVLVIDRINKQYMDLPYDKVSFLKDADLDFDVLQALFWNELFVPGKNVRTNLNEFSVVKQNDAQSVLRLKKAKKLLYQFVANVATGLIQETQISEPGHSFVLHWKYGDFAKLMTKKFPSSMTLEVEGLNAPASVHIYLNHLTSDTDWETRTKVSNRYKKVSPDEILKRLMLL